MKKLTQTEASRYWRSVHGAAATDLAAVCFPDRTQAFNRFFDRVQRHAVRRCLAHLGIAVEGRRVLDWGCGRGRWLGFFAARQATAVGVDISADAAKICQGKGFVVCQGSIAALPFADCSFDVVSSITVIQHVVPEDQEAAIRELQRVLKPGGHAVLIENTSEDPSGHVWGMPVLRWRELFNRSRLVFAENHYFVPLFRLLWRVRLVTSSRTVLNSAEFLALPVAYALEFALMTLRSRRLGTMGLQHVMVFKKSGPEA
jgi:SAM-dependent methyltransferase